LVLAIPALVFFLNAGLNAFTRIDSHRTPFTAGYYVTAIAVAVYLAGHFYCVGSLRVSVLLGCAYLVIYCGCVTFLNWFVFTLTDVSMHVRIAYLLFSCRQLTSDQIQKRYNKSVILKNRTARLLELGQLQIVDGCYVTRGGEVLLGARVCKLLRFILGIPVSPELQDHSRT
jgi:hypothetical protein